MWCVCDGPLLYLCNLLIFLWENLGYCTVLLSPLIFISDTRQKPGYQKLFCPCLLLRVWCLFCLEQFRTLLARRCKTHFFCCNFQTESCLALGQFQKPTSVFGHFQCSLENTGLWHFACTGVHFNPDEKISTIWSKGDQVFVSEEHILLNAQKWSHLGNVTSQN